MDATDVGPSGRLKKVAANHNQVVFRNWQLACTSVPVASESAKTSHGRSLSILGIHDLEDNRRHFLAILRILLKGPNS